MVVRYFIQVEQDSGAPETALFTVPEFRQRILHFDRAGEERRDDERDEVLYVLGGGGVVTVGDETRAFEPGTGAFVARGTSWRVESADDLRVLSVLVEEPLPATSAHSVIVGGERGPATAGREFTLLAQPENGCASVTQFVGHIPAGRAPDHYHRYAEDIVRAAIQEDVRAIGIFKLGPKEARFEVANQGHPFCPQWLLLYGRPQQR